MSRGAFALMAGCLGIAALPAMAAEPRSAIPWLSQSVEETEPAPTTPLRLGAPPDGNETITVTPLRDASRDGVGLLTPTQTGFAPALWGPASASRVRQLLLGHAAQGVPEALALFRKLLLAEAVPPAGSDAASPVLAARLDRLLEMGALEEADALLARAGPDTPELFRRWFDASLLLERAEAPCEALRANPSLSPTLPARVFCLARGGDWNAAEITLTLGENVGSIPLEQERLLARFLDPDLFEEAPDPPPPEPLTPLNFLLREAVGLPRPPGPLPAAFLYVDLSERAPMRARINAGERLVLAGAAPPALLFAAYRAGEPAASGGVWDRAEAVQRLDASLDSVEPEAVAEALIAADDALSARGLRVALARVYAERLAALDPGKLAEPARRRLFELLLLGGATEAAGRAAGSEPEAARLLAVAGAGTAPPLEEASDRMRAAIEGLTRREPTTPRETRLAEMVAEGRQGEAILAALDLVSAGTAVDPSALRAALFGLVRAGQEASARRIALQTLLLGEHG